MRVLDLFSGLRGWSEPFRERGHDVFCVELDERFPADHRDVMDFDPKKWGHFDIVLASPPCTSFSVMRIGTNWTRDHQPKTDIARLGVKLVERTLEIIRQIAPRFWLVENPRAKLRKLPMMHFLDRRTVWYCRYGENRAKPTDLWGIPPPSLTFRPQCWNGNNDCHTAAPRGSRTGTQGMDKALSARIPYELALDVCLAAEQGVQS